MTEFDNLIDKIPDSLELDNLINSSKNTPAKCDEATKGDNEIKAHRYCYEKQSGLPIPQCPSSLVYLLIKVIADRPNLFEDGINSSVAEYYKTNRLEASGLIQLHILSTLYESKSQILTWIKYEKLLKHLIKEKIYKSNTMVDEILAIVKNELRPEIAWKFSSVLDACLKNCREATNVDQEEQGKWCEIIDWMSWFIVQDEME